jgi:ribosome maturation factor RimP
MIQRLKDFEGQQVVINYRTTAGTINNINVKIMFVGQESLIVNVGRKEFRIAKNSVNHISDNFGNKLLTLT